MPYMGFGGRAHYPFRYSRKPRQGFSSALVTSFSLVPFPFGLRLSSNLGEPYIEFKPRCPLMARRCGRPSGRRKEGPDLPFNINFFFTDPFPYACFGSRRLGRHIFEREVSHFEIKAFLQFRVGEGGGWLEKLRAKSLAEFFYKRCGWCLACEGFLGPKLLS